MNKNIQITIYHNPRCSKSRQTLELIRDLGYEPQIIPYLQTPPDLEALRDLLTRLRLPARALLRCHETEYQRAGLQDEQLSDEVILQAMVQYPRLIERPIVVVGDKAVLGRPPENVYQLLPAKG